MAWKTKKNFGATRCAVVPYPGYAHCAYIGTYKLVYGIRYHVHDYVLRRWAAGRYTRVFAIPCSLVASQPRSLACGLAASLPRVRPRSLTATLGPRSHTRDLEASRTRSLAASRPRSLAAFRPRRPSRTAALQPCGLTAFLVHWQPRSRPRVPAASQPPSLTGGLAASLAYW